MYSNLVKSNAPKTHSTYRTIARRLKDCKIDLESHIARDLKVYESTLDGISFIAKRAKNQLLPQDILSDFRRASKSGGLPAFREGKEEDAKHWAFDASMGATVGIGFREIWRPVLTDHGLRVEMATKGPGLDRPMLNEPFSDNFGARINRIDISSLHCAVHGDHCSIHIDETGFVMDGISGLSDDVMLTPDFLRHLLVELIAKDKLRIPKWVDLVIPDSQHSRLGVQFNLVQTDRVHLTVSGTCAVAGKFDCSATGNLTLRHDLFGGNRKR